MPLHNTTKCCAEWSTYLDSSRCPHNNTHTRTHTHCAQRGSEQHHSLPGWVNSDLCIINCSSHHHALACTWSSTASGRTRERAELASRVKSASRSMEISPRVADDCNTSPDCVETITENSQLFHVSCLGARALPCQFGRVASDSTSEF